MPAGSPSCDLVPMQSIVAIRSTDLSPVSPRLLWTARAGAVAVAVGTVAVLIGWAADFGWATRPGPTHATMKVNTAIALLLLAATWLLRPTLARVAAAVAAVIATVSIGEYVVDAGRGIDGWLLAPPTSAPAAGRMALTTALALLALAAGRLIPVRGSRWGRAVEVLALAVVATAMLAVLGYLYNVRSLYSTSPLSTMALPTAVSLMVLGIAMLLVVPGGFVGWLVDGSDAGAVLMRRVLPVTLVLIPVIGYLRLLGQHAGLYDTDFGLAITTVSSMAVLVATTGYTARRLRRVDETREGAMSALRTVNLDLEQRVAERAAQLDAERGISTLLRDRERIAADVHDLVIQRLYAVALTLQSEAGRAIDPEVVETAVDGIDNAMRELRGAIFDLRQPAAADRLSASLEEVVARAAAILPTPPEVVVRGDPSAVPEAITDHLLAVLREAVSNAVRHARPDTLRIELDLAADDVTLTVSDDGCGLDPSVVSSSGLRNMRARAEQLGGSCRWLPRDPHGTTVVWRVPRVIAPAGAARPTRSAQLMSAMLRVGVAATNGRSDPLSETATVICELVDADCIALIVDDDNEHLRVARTRGFPAAVDPRGRRVPRVGTLAEHVLSTGQALRVDNVGTSSGVGRVLEVTPFGPALVVPLRGVSGVHGAISLARFADRAPFTAADEEMAMTLVTHVALALDLGHVQPISRPTLPVDV